MATSRLLIYNGALLLCGERRLANLSENVEPRHLLDNVWNNGGVKTCLEQGQWRFAMRTVLIDYDPGIQPGFGYRRAFEKPSDWCVTAALCQDEFFRTPLLRYSDEAGYLYADLDALYWRYVSNDDAFGMNLGKWPELFREFVEAHFASKVIRKITSDEAKISHILGEDGSGERRGALAAARRKAKNKDAMADPTRMQAQGGWTRARQGYGGRGGPMGDGGSSGSLIG